MKVFDWCQKTTEIFEKKSESASLNTARNAALTEETKYKCGRCKSVTTLNMLLSCGIHQLCPNCATELFYEKIWCAGGLEIDNRIECDECKSTTVVDTIILRSCKCILNAKTMRASQKMPYEFGKKCIFLLNFY